MKIYKYVGDGLGVPGLAHEVPQGIADQLIEDYENELKQCEREAKKARKKGQPYDYNLEGMPGAILKAALENKSYKQATTKGKEEEPETPEDPEIPEEPQEVADG